MEFAVRMTCQKCVDAVNNALEGKEGIIVITYFPKLCFVLNDQEKFKKLGCI